MPHYNIWIRETDNDKWLAIENRSEWLHEKLSPERAAAKVCKIHGTPLDGRGKCLQKGCKYA